VLEVKRDAARRILLGETVLHNPDTHRPSSR
jgi:hypothetical protein